MADDQVQDAPTGSEPADTPGDTPTDASTSNTTDTTTEAPAPAKKAAKRAPAKKASAKKATTKKAAAKKAASAEPDTAVAEGGAPEGTAIPPTDEPAGSADAPDTSADEPVKPAKKAAKKAPARKAAAKRTTKKAAAAPPAETVDEPVAEPVAEQTTEPSGSAEDAADRSGTMPLFQVPEKTTPAKRTRTRKKVEAPPVEEPVEEPVAEEDEDAPVAPDAAEATEADAVDPDATDETTDDAESDDDDSDDDGEGGTGPRRRRRRGGRRRRRTGSGEGDDTAAEGSPDSTDSTDTAASDDEGAASEPSADDADAGDGEGSGSSTRRRRKRRREGEDSGGSDDTGGVATTTRVRKARSPEDEITSIQGSTRLEAKKQRRRDGREAGRRRAPIVSEAEFLARRESVERVMVVRQREDVTQIGVVEDKVLVEHYVARESQTSLIGNIYLGRVQNVLPSMEAAFIDIGKGRNAVIYAGEVNWSALGHKDGNPRKIESVLSSGQTVLVQVTKDPVGHKGARLTSQISLAGRFLVYVPDGTTSGISRKLPDTERNRLKTLLKEVVPSTAGVIVRTAAEGASEEELTQDVERLKARWEEIEAKTKGRGANPQLLHGEPDLTLKVVRDLFTEDFAKLVIQGDDVWNLVHGYVTDMAPDLLERLEKYDAAEHQDVDLFAAYRIDEQIAKALDRKVFLPSGGSLIIDRTEAMTVVDVNTGKFTGSGGNLEETVTKNNLEAAEEVVRQLRLRDIGGIIVVDFIDMVLEANRDLVLRRMVECLGRDRTRHQVAEVTSLGLVQMTRKRIGTGLLEAFSEDCSHCHGRGVVVHDMPIEPRRGSSDDSGGGRGGNGGGNGGGGGDRGGNAGGDRGGDRGGSGGGDRGGDRNGGGESGSSRGGRRRGGRGRGDDGAAPTPVATPVPAHKPTPAEFAAMAKIHKDEADAAASTTEGTGTADAVEAEAPRTDVVDGAEAAATTEPEVITAEPEVDVTVPVSAEPEVAPVEEEAPAEPVVPAEPKVVTRTRRGVSRTVTTTAPVTPVEVVVPAPAPVAPPETAPEPPKVVTRTRGGSSRRTTPAAAPAPEPTEQTDQAEGTEADLGTQAAGEETTELHVPVKRKGTRKR